MSVTPGFAARSRGALALEGGIGMTALERALHYTFADAALLRLALTHPSLKQQDNQRLEFLGDAVLEFLVSEILYAKYPHWREGELTTRRAALVCEETLSALGRALGLGQALLMGHGEEQTAGREKPSILADTFEAVLAAIYLDGGIDAARAFIGRQFAHEEALCAHPGRDEKNLLQEFTQARGMELPAYEIIAEDGPPHARRFNARVCVLGVPRGTGVGVSKKAAEQSAAKQALASLRAEEGEA